MTIDNEVWLSPPKTATHSWEFKPHCKVPLEQRALFRVLQTPLSHYRIVHLGFFPGGSWEWGFNSQQTHALTQHQLSPVLQNIYLWQTIPPYRLSGHNTNLETLAENKENSLKMNLDMNFSFRLSNFGSWFPYGVDFPVLHILCNLQIRPFRFRTSCRSFGNPPPGKLSNSNRTRSFCNPGAWSILAGNTCIYIGIYHDYLLSITFKQRFHPWDRKLAS